jgi:hypothetical protein
MKIQFRLEEKIFDIQRARELLEMVEESQKIISVKNSRLFLSFFMSSIAA